MRRYLLDTAPLAALLRQRPAAVSRMTPWITAHEAATSVVAYAELIEYLNGLPDFPRRQQELRTLLRGVYPFFLTYPILARYANIRRQLRRSPGIIGDMDTLIAATALERNLSVVTKDRDFQHVPMLKVMLVNL